MATAPERAQRRAEVMLGECQVCRGSRWVCENHPDKSWPDGCNCGAGKPCPNCNASGSPEIGTGSLPR